MNCKKCNAQISNGDLFCKYCGTPINNQESNNELSQEFEPVRNNQVSMNNNSMNYQQPMNNSPMNYQQPMNNNQPPYFNNPNYNPMNYQQPKSGKGNMLVIIGGLVLIGVIVVLAILLLGKKGNNANNPSNNNPSNNNPTSSTQPIARNTTSVYFSGYKFEVPTDYIYYFENGGLYIGDAADTWVATIEVFKANFETIKANKNNIASNLKPLGYNLSMAQVRTVKNQELVTLEGNKNGLNVVVGYGKIDSTHCFGTIYYNVIKTANSSMLSDVLEVTKTAKVSSSSNSIAINNFDSLQDSFKTITE